MTLLTRRATPFAARISQTGRYILGRLTLRGLLLLAVGELAILALAGVTILESGGPA